MSTTMTGQTTKQTQMDACPQTVVPFEQINEPGCYICNWSGHLLRVPEDAVALGRLPLMGMVGHDPLFVTKISHNPYIPVTKARLWGADCDVNVNF